MAVPPGNKQVGQVALAVAHTSTAITATSYNITPLALLTDTTAAAVLPLAAKNVMVGSASLTLAHSMQADARTVTCYGEVVLAILRYNPPTSVTLQQQVTLAVVTNNDDAVAPLVALSNVMVGQTAVVVSTQQQYDSANCTCSQMLVLAIVREFHPRKEHTTMNIEYGATAEFNLGGN